MIPLSDSQRMSSGSELKGFWVVGVLKILPFSDVQRKQMPSEQARQINGVTAS